MRKRTSKKHHHPLSPDLAEYVRGTLKTSEIARAHGVSQGAITARAKAAGLPLRRRGRWMKNEPTKRQQRIIRLARKTTGVHAARVFGMTKQRVSKLLKRWSHWMPVPTGGPEETVTTASKRGSKHQIVKRKNRTPPKDHVISFRVDRRALSSLRRQFVNPAFEGLTSENEVARKIVMTALSMSGFNSESESECAT